ncbi:MAG: ABC transporter ATP-binding protein [Sphaerochaetaceae bacterium]
MGDQEKVLSVEDLRFSFSTYAGEVQAVRGVSFNLKKGKTLGLVGESGCGKSVTAKSIVKLNPDNNGFYKGGKITFDGKDILSLSQKEIHRIRAEEVRMIFQDPMTSLNPTMKIGKQITEGIRIANPNINKKEAKQTAIESLKNMGISNPEKRFNYYPHQFSGGMRQRVMIALAMSVNPKLLIADEPTTALDVTLQAQILELIKKIQLKFNTAIIMITHDLGVVANIADEIAVMYAGKIMEFGDNRDIFYNPFHPYTWGILQSIPPIDADCSVKLTPIPGTPPDLFNPPKGCPFAARCPYAMKICRLQYPEEFKIDNHKVNCWLYHELSSAVKNPITKKEVCLCRTKF